MERNSTERRGVEERYRQAGSSKDVEDREMEGERNGQRGRERDGERERQRERGHSCVKLSMHTETLTGTEGI